eukprot:CAMPEP_0194352826 /NCGR_PEP_ID=MMETSP0174-20130528/1265_1 /TAXON_ID=216777 /ORGANISM="Proboscia alata, Strain PI-D3" /LENGTH=78 /DNA_ID=CAMNT_0039121131 /DNA_START=52 /DNA_END=288 /DNA_ORIENTATION=+
MVETDGAPKKETTWKLPDNIEHHIESGLLNSAVGVLVGGAVSVILFRSGKGMRTAGMSVGLGVAIGSTIERARKDLKW